MAQSQGSAPTTKAATPATRRRDPPSQSLAAPEQGAQHQEPGSDEEVSHLGRGPPAQSRKEAQGDDVHKSTRTVEQPQSAENADQSAEHRHAPESTFPGGVREIGIRSDPDEHPGNDGQLGNAHESERSSPGHQSCCTREQGWREIERRSAMPEEQ